MRRQTEIIVFSYESKNLVNSGAKIVIIIETHILFCVKYSSSGNLKGKQESPHRPTAEYAGARHKRETGAGKLSTDNQYIVFHGNFHFLHTVEQADGMRQPGFAVGKKVHTIFHGCLVLETDGYIIPTAKTLHDV